MEYELTVSDRTSTVEVHVPEGASFRLSKYAPQQDAPPGQKADFIFVDSLGERSLHILRTRRFPHPRYSIMRAGQAVGTIECMTLLRNRYRISLSTGVIWDFHLPLYSTFFFALSNQAGAVNVRMLRANHWALLFGPGQESPELLSSLALIFRVRWTSS